MQREGGQNKLFIPPQNQGNRVKTCKKKRPPKISCKEIGDQKKIKHH